MILSIFCDKMINNRNPYKLEIYSMTKGNTFMKLCTKCKRLHNDEDTVCSNCNSTLENITDDNTPVYLLSANGFELQRIKTALEDSCVPCDSIVRDKELRKQEFNNKSAMSDILVPYAAYEKAYDICIGIGAIKEDDTQILDNTETSDFENAENQEATLDEKFEKMSGVKRTTVRVASAVVFLALIALAVYGTDAITAFIKGFFS